MEIIKSDIIKYIKKYVREPEYKKTLLTQIEAGKGHSARIISESLRDLHPKSKKMIELDTMIMDYFNFG